MTLWHVVAALYAMLYPDCWVSVFDGDRFIAVEGLPQTWHTCIGMYDEESSPPRNPVHRALGPGFVYVCRCPTRGTP